MMFTSPAALRSHIQRIFEGEPERVLIRIRGKHYTIETPPDEPTECVEPDW